MESVSAVADDPVEERVRTPLVRPERDRDRLAELVEAETARPHGVQDAGVVDGAGAHAALAGACDAKKSSDGGGLWVTADVGTYDEMQAACEQGGGHLVVPASEDERLAAVAAVQASIHGDVAFWVGYTLAAYDSPGEEASYAGEGGSTMAEVGYWAWGGPDSGATCGKCGKAGGQRRRWRHWRRRCWPRSHREVKNQRGDRNNYGEPPLKSPPSRPGREHR